MIEKMRHEKSDENSPLLPATNLCSTHAKLGGLETRASRRASQTPFKASTPALPSRGSRVGSSVDILFIGVNQKNFLIAVRFFEFPDLGSKRQVAGPTSAIHKILIAAAYMVRSGRIQENLGQTLGKNRCSYGDSEPIRPCKRSPLRASGA